MEFLLRIFLQNTEPIIDQIVDQIVLLIANDVQIKTINKQMISLKISATISDLIAKSDFFRQS